MQRNNADAFEVLESLRELVKSFEGHAKGQWWYCEYIC
tara:strand:+ start:228 stop:341 length:114 start_codon:yes stop_codon:yes gene_type:complete